MSDTLDLVGRSATLAAAEAVDRLVESLREREDCTAADDSLILIDALKRAAPQNILDQFQDEKRPPVAAPTQCLRLLVDAMVERLNSTGMAESQFEQLFKAFVGVVRNPAAVKSLEESQRGDVLAVAESWLDRLLDSFRPPTTNWS